MSPEPMPEREKYERSLRLVSPFVLENKLRELRKYIDPYEMWYDIGAGMGQYSVALQDEGYRITAVEPLEGYYEYAVRQRAEDLTVCADGAFLINVLHHSDDPVRLLRHLRTLCPKIVVSELNRENRVVEMFVRFMLPWEDINGHLNANDVRHFLSLAGWTRVKDYSTSLLGVSNVYNWFVCEDR